LSPKSQSSANYWIRRAKTFENAAEILSRNIQKVLEALISPFGTTQYNYQDLLLHWDTDIRAVQLWEGDFFALKTQFKTKKFDAIKRIKPLLPKIIQAAEKYGLNFEDLSVFPPIKAIDLGSFFKEFNPEYHLGLQGDSPSE
jgi:hypothetical protein